MSKKSSYWKNIASVSLPFTQVLFVFLAFALMCVVSYFLANRIERMHLEKESAAMAIYIESQLNSDLNEFETMLNVTSETIRRLIIQKASFEEIKSYVIHITQFGREEAHVAGFHTIFIMFDKDIFPWPEKAGFNGIAPDMDWVTILSDGSYVPEEREWYKAAVEADGDVGVTEPYANIIGSVFTITYSRCIFDDDGKRIAIVSLDVSLDRLHEFSMKNRAQFEHDWMLFDRNLRIIAHYDNNIVGLTLREVRGGLSELVDDFEQKKEIAGRRLVNHLGQSRFYTFRTLDNGWHLGVSTLEDSYHKNLNTIIWFLIIVGLFLSVGLSVILIRIHREKHKAIEEKNMLINFGDIMNGLDVMIYVNDPVTNKILFINDSMKKHFNIEGDCVGMLCYKVLQKNINQKCSFCPCNQLDKDPSMSVVWEEHGTITNRIYRNVDRYIDWPGGKKVHMQSSVDTTELVAAKEFAERSSRYKSSFLANMSHEIRTPMNAILGIAEIRLQDKSLSPENEEAYEKIYESGDLLLNIINDILDLSKIEAGKLELVPVRYDIPSLINDTAQLNRLRYDSKPIEFTLNVAENLPHDLLGDELRIKQVLNNILSNAFKYTSEGSVTLSVSCEQSEESDDIIVIFSVSDTGQGITEEQLGKIFDEYTRFYTDNNRTTVGTGLGMSITKRLLDMMNGEISVKSEPGKGSTFTVRIPQKRLGQNVCGSELIGKLRDFNFHSSTITKKASFIREYMPYGSVLVVDDVESNVYVVKGMLLPYGLKVEAVTSGYAAIEKIKNGYEYDVIFMDHMMPKMDGIEATKIIRSMGYTRSIVALTANALVGRAQMFLQNGFDGFVSKPIDSRELNQVLNDFIRNKKPPEVVVAARRQQLEKEKDNSVPAHNIANMLELRNFFIQDAENTVSVLESLDLDNLDEAGLELFIVTIHGMKSALFNIGEKDYSSMAYRLEKAGLEREYSIISNDTSAFLNVLKNLITRFLPEKSEEITKVSDEDLSDLRDRLNILKVACTAFDRNAAKDVLNDLRQKAWPSHINAVLDEISINILHSSFKKAAAVIDDFKL